MFILIFKAEILVFQQNAEKNNVQWKNNSTMCTGLHKDFETLDLYKHNFKLFRTQTLMAPLTAIQVVSVSCTPVIALIGIIFIKGTVTLYEYYIFSL